MDDNYQYKSHSRYVVQNIRKQAGIKGTETIDEILNILSDDEIARQIDNIVNSADYNSPGYIRYTFEGAQLIARRCTPKADKIFTTFLAFANQGLRITISQADLAELTLMSKPTVAAALKELESIYAIIIIPGDSRGGEADTYYINPAICACSKMSKQTAQEAVFWNLLKEEDATEHSKYEKARQARLKFKQLITDVMSEFEKTFSRMENRDSNTREPLGVTIERQGKLKTQEQVGRRRRKKGVSAGHTDTEQDTTSPTCPERYELPVEEQAILGLMERIQNQTSGAVAVYKTVFASVLHLNDRQRKSLQKYLDHLTEMCFLTCIYKPPRGSKKPGVYIVNRAVSWIGTGTDNAKGLKIKNPGTYKQIPETVILPDGTKVICGTLGEIPKKDEEANVEDADPVDNTAEPCNGSAPQDNSNQDTRKNQVNSNMPKNSNLLTPEEELMFSGTLKKGAEREQCTNI